MTMCCDALEMHDPCRVDNDAIGTTVTRGFSQQGVFQNIKLYGVLN